MTELTGARILVTRPIHQTQHLCHLIRQSGGNPIIFPTIAIEEIADKTALTAIVQQLDHFDLGIFTSANSVFKTAILIQQYWPQLPTHLKLAAIGKATAQALAKFNLTMSIYPEKQFNSEELLALPALQNVRNTRIVIFRGQGGREFLAKNLQNRGAKITEAIAYQRVVPVTDSSLLINALHADAIDIIINTSQESLQNLLHLMGAAGYKDLVKIPLLSVSLRVADTARMFGFNQIMIAENASDEALLKALIMWKGENHARRNSRE